MTIPKKIVLFPFGPVRDDASRGICEGLIFQCGGDIERFFDSPVSSIERFIRYVSRIEDLVRPGFPPQVVVITQTVPLALTAIKSRRMMCMALPLLERALWTVFVDPALDPAFEITASKLGDLDDQLSHAPVWTTHAGERYLVLTPQTQDIAHVRIRVQTLETCGNALFSHRPRQSGKIAAVQPDGFTNPPKSKS